MNENEKDNEQTTVDEEQEEQASDSGSEENKETEEEQSSEDSSSQDEQDDSTEDPYKKELEKLEKEKGQVQHNLDKTIAEKTALKKKLEEYESQDDEDQDEKLRSIVQQEITALEARLQASQADSVIAQYATNDSHAKLIKYHMENTIRPSGNLQEDVKRASVLASPNRDSQIKSEIQKANQKQTSKSSSSGQRGSQGHSRPKLSEQDEKMLKVSKAQWDSKKGVFKFPSGRTWTPPQQ